MINPSSVDLSTSCHAPFYYQTDEHLDLAKKDESATLKYWQNPEKLDSRNKLIQNSFVCIVLCFMVFFILLLISLMILAVFRHKSMRKMNRIGLLMAHSDCESPHDESKYLSLASDFAYPSIAVQKR